MRAMEKDVSNTMQPRLTRVFRFVRASYTDGVAELAYAFDDGEELVETIRLNWSRRSAFRRRRRFPPSGARRSMRR